MSKWYGSLDNRVEENRMFCDEIKVGTGMTEYWWSDRRAYEVVAVKDQKHISVREYDHKRAENWVEYSNRWELVSNENNPVMDMVKRGKYWYFTATATLDDIKDLDVHGEIEYLMAGFDLNVIREKGKQTKLKRANVSFGVANYYYDYEF